MKILGIETSCDETSAAVIEGKRSEPTVSLLSNIISSSVSLHAKTGGIIPEIAAREQIKYIIPVIEKAVKESNLYLPSSKINHPPSTFHRPNIDAIAVTIGPGLIGSLLVGVETAKTLAYVWNKPIIPVNHLIGHIYANFIKQPLSLRGSASWRRRSKLNQNGLPRSDRVGPRNDIIGFPAIALVVSGGHTDLVLMKNHGEIKWLGGTRDDAAGEAFDKIGRLLGLSYPAGPVISKLAEKGNPKSYHFPRPMIDSKDFDFSFSGLKTAVLREVQRYRGSKSQRNQFVNDVSTSVEHAIVDVLTHKTIKAAQKFHVKSILLGGGVAANQKLRAQIELDARRYQLDAEIFIPEKSLCTDNAAMIASAAFFNFKPQPWHEITANPELYFD